MYGKLIDFQEYASDRGDYTPIEVDKKEAQAALVRASDYIKLFYVSKFKKAHIFKTAPEYVLEATYIAASIELKTSNFFSKTYTPSQQKVLTQLGDIKWTLIPNNDDNSSSIPVSPSIEALLSKYVKDNVSFLGIMVA